jgi:hypothetical protein
MAGFIQRHALQEVALLWNHFYENSPFRVSAIDAWQLTDNRPETTAHERYQVTEDPEELGLYINEAEGKFIYLIQ